MNKSDDNETIYLTVRVKLTAGCNIDEVVENMQYEFHDSQYGAILETEIMEWNH